MTPDRWSAAAVAIAAVVAVLLLRVAVHTDDLQVVRFAAETGYADLWTTAFRDDYYRPLVSSIVKLGHDTVGVNLTLRVVGALLIAANLLVFARLVAPLVGPARLGGALCLLGAPFTFVALFPFGVGIGDSLVGLALLAAIVACRAGAPGWWRLAAVVLALTAKESGLVVAAYVGAESLRARRWTIFFAVVGLACGFVALHAALIDTRPYILKTGYGFDLLSIAEQQARFGDSPLPLRAWTAASNLISALIYVPYKGQLAIKPADVAHAVAIGWTTAVCAAHVARDRRYRSLWPLLVLLPANAVLGYSYVRPRIMFAAYFAIALILASAIDRGWRDGKRRLAIATLAIWVAELISALIRMVSIGN